MLARFQNVSYNTRNIFTKSMHKCSDNFVSIYICVQEQKGGGLGMLQWD